MGRLTAPVRFVLALLLLAGAGTVRAEESWIKVTAGHYTAYSRQDEAHTLRWLADFDRFIDGAAGLLGIDTGQLSPLTLVIFADEAELHPYLPRNADGHARTYTRAVFAQGRGRAIAALAATPGDSAARRLLFHEGAHWLLAHAPADRIPAWLDEGVAQLLATAEPDEHGLRWGAPEAAMLRFARLPAVRLLTPSTVVTAHRDDPLFDTGPGAGAFYAQAWALVHSLLLDGEGLAGGLDAETLSALAAAGPDELARRLGLRSPDALDAYLRAYLHRPGHATAAWRPAGNAAVARASAPRVEPAAAAEVAAARGGLALLAGAPGPRPELAAAGPAAMPLR